VIIARSPLRISLGGGGTDLPSFYRAHSGFLIAGAIDKYVYVTVHRPFVERIFLKYSQFEDVQALEDVKHPIIREALKYLGLNSPRIEISSMADIPSGTGLGSSGSFTTALIKALYAYKRCHLGQDDLAELACYVEIDLLAEPIGKQDQYIAAIGGITCFHFNKNDTVVSETLGISTETLYALEEDLLLFFTGHARSASEILKDQDDKSRLLDSAMIDNLEFVKELGFRSRDALLGGDVILFGQILHEHWMHKRLRSQGISNPRIDEWYDLGIRNGAVGGKLVGAGGGGFLMFMAHDRTKLRRAMAEAGLEEVRFKFDYEGTKVLMSS